MNISGLVALFDQIKAYRELVDSLKKGRSSESDSLGLSRASRPPIIASLFKDLAQPTLLVVSRVDQAQKLAQDLGAYLSNSCTPIRFPEPNPLPFDRSPWGRNSRNERLYVLGMLQSLSAPLGSPDIAEACPLVITSARALLQKTLPLREFLAHTRRLNVGQLVRLEKLLEAWLHAGYRPATVVEEPGTFCRRGGIVDVCPPAGSFWSPDLKRSSQIGVRIELFGEEIETLRSFDLATQRTLSSLESIIIPPAREALPRFGPQVAAQLSASSQDGEWRQDLEFLADGMPFPELEFYLSYFHQNAGSLFEYWPNDSLILVDDWSALQQEIDEIGQQAERFSAERRDAGALPPDYPSPIFDGAQITHQLSSRGALELGGLTNADSDSDLRYAFSPGPRFGGQVKPFIDHMVRQYLEGDRVVVVTRQAARLADLWHEHGPAIGPTDEIDKVPERGTVTFVQGTLEEGFTLYGSRLGREKKRAEILDDVKQESLLHLLTDAEIFGWSRPEPRKTPPVRPVVPEAPFSDISPGALVVHIDHGIGRFEGLVTRKIGELVHEYLMVTYAEGDQLYVPTHQADRLSRYVGAAETRPILHRLGGTSWSQAKARTQKAIEEYADELLALYASRSTAEGHAFQTDTAWQAELEASFPYVETMDQLTVISDVKADMEKPRPMDRLICGDVGYGKTEVALRAAFKAVMDGKQVGVLVPTTVLAQQHYNNFGQRLATFPIEIRMLSRFRTRAEQSRILTALAAGKVDIIVGTHRLLQKDVTFKDLGLLIVDEEQRFGVAHKEMLKQFRTEVDVLTMTATPIPRTLYMSLTGVRDISLLSTPPEERLPVRTHMGQYDPQIVKRAILREMDRGGQVFFVHNRVQTIESVAQQIQRLVPEARLAVGHGQMHERDLENVMLSFVGGNIDVLVSTSIIENGLDIPNANTIIVDRSELFGLSQLYQLRGRVGRGARRAYSYFFFRNSARLSTEARARLETLAEHTDLGAGYNIAMRDLEIRGAGDILGTRQHGHISAIGFDLYTRLLARAVQQRRDAGDVKIEISKTEIVLPPLPGIVTIELPLNSHIPEAYIPEPEYRFRLYRRMAGLSTMEAIDEMASELSDRFGPIPDPVDNLLFQIRIKLMASQAGILGVSTLDGQLCIRMEGLESINRMTLQLYLGNDVRVSKTAVWMRPKADSPVPWKVSLVQVLERLSDWQRR